MVCGIAMQFSVVLLVVWYLYQFPFADADSFSYS
jgi:hypothetical protein